MKAMVLVLGLFAFVSPLVPAQETTARLRIGDPAPTLGTIEWIRGTPDTATARITVLEIWATWSPPSRLLLARHDSLQAALRDRGVRILAVTQEDPEDVRVFLATAGWKNLAIGCDLDGTVRRTYLDAVRPEDPPFIPYACLIGRDAGGTRRVFWMNAVIDLTAPRPLEAFDTALGQMIAGEYDLPGAIEIARQQERSMVVMRELADAFRADDLDRLGPLLEEIAGLALDPGYQSTLVTNLNTLAWQLVTREGRTQRQVEIARRACEIALARGGEKDAAFLDTYARVLFESGRVEEAYAMEQKSVALLDASRISPEERREYVAALTRYREALGLPEPAPAETTPAAGGDTAVAWDGTMNESFRRFDRSLAILVRPSSYADSTREAAWDREMASLITRFYGGCPVRRPEDVTPVEKSSRILVLYGTPESNALTREVLGASGIALFPDSVVVGEQRLRAVDPVVIAAVPSPWNPELPVRFYTTLKDDQANNLNSFFHGPTAFLVGEWQNGQPEVRVTLDFLPVQPGGASTLHLDIGPTFLDADRAVADLRRLHDLLAEGYAGYADVEWDLGRRGSSWKARTAEYAQRLSSRDTWRWYELFEELRTYLEPIQDAHFYMEETAIDAAGDCQRSTANMIRYAVPYFTDLRVSLRESRPVIAEAPDSLAEWRGAGLPKAAPVPGPNHAATGVPYLFPTLPCGKEPSSGRTGQFLLGLLAYEDDPPESIVVELQPEPAPGNAAPAVVRAVVLPVHRGRVRSTAERAADWSLAWPPETPCAVLSVQTMNPQSLQQMPETADTLRTLPRVMLDLRNNHGGGDAPAMQWCSRFSGQEYRWVGSVSRWPGSIDPLAGWISILGSPMSSGFGAGALVSAGTPYPGRLFVFTDKGVMSSGESFALLSGQVPNALVLGENTAGCTNYGNVEPHGPLPNSRIRLGFGRTRFVQDCVKPNREGSGLFPDYWLDVRDPIRWTTECLGWAGEAR